MLGRESDYVGLSLPQGLLDQVVAGALIEPRVHPAGEGALPLCGNGGDWTILGRFGVVVLHFDFMRGKLRLNPGGLIAAGASEILLRVGQQIGVECKLRLGNFQIVSCRFGRGGLLVGSPICQTPHLGLIVVDDLLQLFRTL